MVYENSIVKKTWIPYGFEDWYIVPATIRYRDYNVYATSMGGKRILDTVELLPYDIPTPTTTLVNNLLRAAVDFTSASKIPIYTSSGTIFGDQQVQVLDKL